MQSVIGKEQVMKAIFATGYVRLVAVLAVAASLALVMGGSKIP